MVVREGADRARALAALQKERADRLELTNAELERKAHEDALTGIANRRGLDIKLAELYADRRVGRRCSLALLDIDRFKWVNDTFLHTTGDKVLSRLGAVLRECSREKDFVARFGGEEFAVALVDIAPVEVAAACERIRAAIAGAAWSELHADLVVTVSVGFAHFDETDEGIEGLVRLADARLFEAKRAGRNRVVGSSEGTGSQFPAPLA
jgi:diguanylate cyclase (GGDEF)-like protein